MASFPQDPYMLLSMVNMKLRDRFSSLDALCEDMDLNRKEIEAVLPSYKFFWGEPLFEVQRAVPPRPPSEKTI